MKRIFAVLGLTALLVSGCRAGAQQPPSPTTYTCPPAVLGGTAYTEVNAPANTGVAASITGSPRYRVPLLLQYRATPQQRA